MKSGVIFIKKVTFIVTTNLKVKEDYVMKISAWKEVSKANLLSGESWDFQCSDYIHELNVY